MRLILRAAGYGLRAALVFAAGTAWAGSAPNLSDSPPAEMRIWPSYSADLPVCDDPVVLATIQRKFVSRESDYWTSSLAIESFSDVRETGFRSRGLSFVPKRFCKGRVALNDGAQRAVVYEIGEGLGFIGVGYGVEWCVDGLDRNHAFAPNCRAAGR